MGNYVENIAFFMGYVTSGVELENYKASSIFQDEEEKYTQDINDEQLLQDIRKILTNTTDALTIGEITLTLSKFGVCNLRIKCIEKEIVDPDDFGFYPQYEVIYIKIETFLKSQNMIQENEKLKPFMKKVDIDYRYLYHQHLTNRKIDNVNWSIYEYNTDKVADAILDVDSLLLERQILYYVFSRCYVELFDDIDHTNKNSLERVRLLLNTNRKLLARHELLLQELDTEHFEKFSKYLPVHHIDDTAKTYDRLENNIEHLSEQLEDERRHRDSIVMERIFLVLALIGLVSVITGLLALLPGKDAVGCDTNTTDFILSNTYSYALGIPGNIVIGISVVLFVAGLWMMFKPHRKN